MTTPRSQTSDVLVMGGGPAGAAAAILLARAGRRVTLIEREPQPRHKVCGEFLSEEALQLLAHLGIDAAHHGAAAITTVRFASKKHLTQACLPFHARSLTRRCLDTHLLHAAEVAGVDVRRGRTVERLSTAQERWQVLLDEGTTLSAPTGILATGKHDLRGWPRPRGPHSDLVALKMYFRLQAGQQALLAGAVELLQHRAGYAGLQLVEDGSANLCGLLRRDRLAEVGGWQGWLTQLRRENAHAAERLEGAEPLLPKPLALSAIPYGYLRRNALAPTLYAAGDQAAVIPSFTGDGISLALYTGFAAARSILTGEEAAHSQAQLAHALSRQMMLATFFSRTLLHSVAGPSLATLARLWPGSLRSLASRTRLGGGDRALLATCLSFCPEDA